MTFSFYDASVPVVSRALNQFSHILDKGAADAEERKIDPSIYINARLAPDMFPLSKQVQIASDVSKGLARIAGVDVPSFPDTETSFAELKERIAKTVAFIQGLDRKAIEEGKGRKITLKIGGRELHFDGKSYLTGFILPNVFFHSATTYAILRHNGVKLGKADFLGEA